MSYLEPEVPVDQLPGFVFLPPESVVIKETSKKPEFKKDDVQEVATDSVFNMGSIIEEVLREHAKFLEKLLKDTGLTVTEFNEKFYLEEDPQESEMMFDYDDNKFGIRFTTRYRIRMKGKHSES